MIDLLGWVCWVRFVGLDLLGWICWVGFVRLYLVGLVGNGRLGLLGLLRWVGFSRSGCVRFSRFGCVDTLGRAFKQAYLQSNRQKQDWVGSLKSNSSLV